MSEELNRLRHKRNKAERQLRKAENDLKAIQHGMKQMTRAERTHRLCTRGGMLETFLREPLLLTDDDVMEILRFVLHGESSQKMVDAVIARRRKRNEAEQTENPNF